MFLMKLFKSIYTKDKFYLNNKGNHERDFTYIYDVVHILTKLMKIKIKKKYDIFNICSNKPLNISKLLKHINSKIVKVKYTNISKNPLDVNKTHGSNNKVTKLLLLSIKSIFSLAKTSMELSAIPSLKDTL